MDNKEWFDCGARIGDLVQSAIDSKNYQHLNQAITDTINDTIDSFQRSFLGDTREKPNQQRGYREYRERGTAYGQARERANTGDLFDLFSGKGGSGSQTRAAGSSQKVKKSWKGIATMITGFSLAGFFGIGALSFGIGASLLGGGFWAATVLLTLLAAASGILGYKGYGERRRQKRAGQYMTIVGNREYCSVEELAAGTGRSVKDVQKDLRGMIADGMFDTAAYLDQGETTFMVSQSAYRQYQETLKASRAREEAMRREAQERRSAEKNMSNVSEETQSILREGQEFIRHIHQSNERIPDETMTQKLNVLEQVVTRIFQQVEARPESAPDLHRMMSYYLPITKKLIDAYIDLDDQNLQGANARKTRKEIELSLDTINGAFETFLDSFFEDTAWDISSDISTLKTMMARDGLTGNKDFAGGERIRTVGDDLQSMAGSSRAGSAARAE